MPTPSYKRSMSFPGVLLTPPALVNITFSVAMAVGVATAHLFKPNPLALIAVFALSQFLLWQASSWATKHFLVNFLHDVDEEGFVAPGPSVER